MARYQAEHKAATRRRLVESAVTAFRRDGVDSTGLKEIMGDLGLTVGGFYRHFPSKSDLVQAAVSAGLQQSLARMRSLPGDDGLAWLECFAAGYLSETHRRSIDQGCVLPALAPTSPAATTKSGNAAKRVFAKFRRSCGGMCPTGATTSAKSCGP